MDERQVGQGLGDPPEEAVNDAIQIDRAGESRAYSGGRGGQTPGRLFDSGDADHRAG